MPAWFYNLHVVAALFLIYLVFGLIGLCGYIINRKYFKVGRTNTNTAASSAQQTGLSFGTLFIAFWIALNWQTLDNLNLDSEREAQSIINLYNNAQLIDNPQLREQTQIAVQYYLNSIINNEYKSLEQGKLSPDSAAKIRELSSVIYTLPTTTLEEKTTYIQITSALNTLIQNRFDRLDYVEGQINGVLLVFFMMLLALICFWGGFIYHRNGKLTIMSLFTQHLVILTSAWLILEIDRPFQGYFKVDNYAFIKADYYLQHQHTQQIKFPSGRPVK